VKSHIFSRLASYEAGRRRSLRAAILLRPLTIFLKNSGINYIKKGVMELRKDAVMLLADVLNWTEENILAVLELCSSYNVFKKRKRDGSYRKISAPHPLLKKFQRRLLRYFLHRINVGDWDVIQGCLPKHSIVSNAERHCRQNARFVLRLDLKNAFPSVKNEFIAEILRLILMKEISVYQKGYYLLPPLFSKKKARWFRDLFGKYNQPSLFFHAYNPQKIMGEFVDLLLPLVTFQGELPQGAPSSPYLLNIAIAYSGIVEKIRNFMKKNEVIVFDNDRDGDVTLTVYVDDFTLSSSKPIKWETIAALIKMIEEESPFKVNRKKILYFRRDRVAPLVTGLRLVRLKKSRRDLEKSLQKDSSLTEKQRNGIINHSLNEKGEWIVSAVRIPKTQIRKIRGLIYRACLPEYREKLARKVEGYIAYLKAIYGDDLPRQVAIPWAKYQSLQN
jgi:hypothetical protein